MTEADRIFDMKLKNLIIACKASGNYKKLAIVGYLSLSNLLDEICLKLGMPPRRKENGERLLEYMRAVNEMFYKNLKIYIFKDSIVAAVQEIELLYLRSQGNLPYKYIKSLYGVYYELRKLEVPNLYKNLTGEDQFDRSNLHMLNYYSRKFKRKEESSNKFKSMILQKIREQERSLQGQLRSKFTPSTLEKMIFLKKVKTGITANGKKSVSFQGTLKNHLDYQQTHDGLKGYMLMGVLFLASLIFTLMVIQIIIFPFIMGSITNLLLILGGIVLFLFLLCKSYNKRR